MVRFLEMIAAHPVESLRANDLVDLLLLALVDRGGGTILVEPSEGKHAIRHEEAGRATVLGRVGASMGDAIVARLALLAGLPVGEPDARVGRIRVRPTTPLDAAPAPVTELLVAVRTTAAGLAAELHRLGVVSGPAVMSTLSPTELASGAFHVGSYRLLGELGRGGMGIVYMGEHVVLQKPVAIKVLHAEVANVPAIAAQFIVEARAACRARHPGIVDVTDFGTFPDGRAFLVMELVEAPTLSDLLRAGPLPVPRALAVARDIAEALGAASAQGVIHRDLTPANVFVRPGDRIQIGDFGLARIVEGSPPPSDDEPKASRAAIVGTAGYMSPEQGMGEPVDTRSDVYALGIVLYRMLTGHLPFDGSSMVEIIMKHMTRPVPPLVGPAGPLPDPIQKLVLRALAKRKEERFQSPDDMRAAIVAAAEGVAA
jgi:serine/threonine-protein kinase